MKINNTYYDKQVADINKWFERYEDLINTCKEKTDLKSFEEENACKEIRKFFVDKIKQWKKEAENKKIEQKEQAELERKAAEQSKTNELAAQCREKFKDFLANSEDVKQFASIVTIENEIKTGNALLETNKNCSNQLNPLNMRIKALEERKQMIIDEQKNVKRLTMV